MVTNEEIADQIDELGDRLLLDGDSWFKVAAYHRAATTFRGLSEELTTIVAEGRLRKLKGIGEAISSKVEAYLETGHIPALDRIRDAQPAGLLALFRQTGIAPRRLRALATGPLGIDSPDKLRSAIDSGAFEAFERPDAKEKVRLGRWRGGMLR